MRKLSLFILAASATLGVSMAQADDAVDASAGTDAPEVQVLPPAPADDADQTADPVLLVEDLDLHPIDQVVDLPEESGDPAPEVNIYHQLNTGDGAIDDTAATDDTSVVDDTAVTDDTAATDDTGTKEEVPTDDSAATDDTGTTDDADQTADPVLLVEDLDLHPIDQVVDLPEESGDPAPEVNIYHQLNTGDGAIDDTAATDDTSVVDDTAVTDDTAATDDTGTKEEVPTDDSAATDDTGTTDEVPTDDTELNPIMYTTSGGTDVRPDGCMQCRTLTGESAGVEAPAPEVTADVLDGNATGVDVMDPVEAKKPRSN